MDIIQYAYLYLCLKQIGYFNGYSADYDCHVIINEYAGLYRRTMKIVEFV